MEYRRRVCRAMNYISRNLDRDLSLEKVAKVSAFSMFHFHRIFKAVVGETISDFTRRLRLESAANRLLYNKSNITQIAIDCGFSSSQNFAKAFRQHFGMSPSAYRKSNIGNKNSKGENAFSLQPKYSAETEFDNLSENGRGVPMNAEVREMPEYHMAYLRKIAPYCKKTCEQAISDILQWAKPRGYLVSSPMFLVYWDNPEITRPEKCRIDACVRLPNKKIPEDLIGIQIISGGPYAVCHFEINDEDFMQSWENAFAWLVNSGYECDDSPCYELYHNNAEEHPEYKWIFDICIPLKNS